MQKNMGRREKTFTGEAESTVTAKHARPVTCLPESAVTSSVRRGSMIIVTKRVRHVLLDDEGEVVRVMREPSVHTTVQVAETCYDMMQLGEAPF
jgi:hypothetical protein